MTFQQLSQMLKARLGEAARRVPTRALPNWLVHMGALVDRSLKSILPELGKPKAATSDKARRLLGWSPRPNSDAVVATAESLIQLGLLPQSSRAVNESK